MVLRFPCPRCRTIHRAADNAAGKRAKCLNCGEALRVPTDGVPAPPTRLAQHDATVPSYPALSATPNHVRYLCPGCKQEAWATEQANLICGKCKKSMEQRDIENSELK